MAVRARSATPPMEKYYSKRAAEYEQIYQKPERQHELEWLRRRVPELLADRTVLEVACGSGRVLVPLVRAGCEQYPHNFL